MLSVWDMKIITYPPNISIPRHVRMLMLQRNIIPSSILDNHFLYFEGYELVVTNYINTYYTDTQRLHFAESKVFLVWMIDNSYHLLHERKPI